MSANLKIWRESASLILAAKSNFSKSSSFNYKILCLKRSSKSEFMPGTYVFPGGNLSKTDNNLSWLQLYEEFGVPKQSFEDLQPVENNPAVLQNDEKNKLPKYLSFRICAIREAFEECGVLLCRNPKINRDTVSKWASFIGGRELSAWQHKVHDNPEEFLNLCRHFEIYPDVWALKNWSNWATPPTLATSKFNTIFFLATSSQMPPVHKDEREVQDLMWTTPEQCIAMHDKEAITLPVPQFYEMSRFKTQPDIEKLSNFATERSKLGFETYCPYRIVTEEGLYSILPGDDLYPAEMDKNNTKPLRMTQLPDSRIKNRILHKSKHLNIIKTQNFTPKCNHIVPPESATLN